MFPEKGDIVIITDSDKEEAIGSYGMINELIGSEKVRVLYRHVMITAKGSFGNSVVVNRKDVSLVCKVGDKTKGLYLEELL